MTLNLRRAADRGHENHGWLDARHSFSFANYYDPDHMGFRALRVINEDRVAVGAGFPTHGHRDMEIVTYVIAGALAHKDSTGGEGVLHRGDVQAMSAGTGVRHSEFNPLDDKPLHLLQIWIVPALQGLAPSYRQATYSDADKHNRFCTIAASHAADGGLLVNQDARISASILDRGAELRYDLAPGRGVWIQLIGGEIDLNGEIIRAGDGASTDREGALMFKAKSDAEFLLFDLGP